MIIYHIIPGGLAHHPGEFIGFPDVHTGMHPEMAIPLAKSAIPVEPAWFRGFPSIRWIVDRT